MKKNINQFLIATIACLSIACSDLQENEPSGFKEEFFKTGNEKLLIQRVGDPVQHLRLMLDNQKTWEAHEAATDELVIPTQGGGWDDGGKWRVMHMHEFTSSSPVTLEAWKWAFKGVSKCNSVIKLFKEVGGNKVPKYISQARTLRAYYYWHLIDLFGNVPIVTKVDMTDGISPETSPRKDVYSHIVTELNEVLSDTSFVNSTKTSYGFPTVWMAKALLAKMYLNAEVYGGTPNWDEAIKQCNDIIASNKFGYTNDFQSIFRHDNGPQIKEIIFSIVNSTNEKASVMSFPQRIYPGAFNGYTKTFGSWNGYHTLPTFYDKYTDANDVRLKSWFVGEEIKWVDGTIMKDKEGKNIKISKNIRFEVNPNNKFDIGGGAEIQGARSNKYAYDPTSLDQTQNNDYVVFRYSDIELMKAEAEARKANNPSLALTAVNQLRTIRNASPLTSLTWNDLLDERGREFAFEMWRRNDLIRFNKWGEAWGLKPNTQNKPNLKLMPIPVTEIQINNKLKQNEGY